MVGRGRGLGFRGDTGLTMCACFWGHIEKHSIIMKTQRFVADGDLRDSEVSDG